MKTITLDYDLYIAELDKAKEDGKLYGFSLAADFVRDNDFYAVINEEYHYRKRNLLKAIEEKYTKKEGIS